jgi:hypothetical protein
MAGYIWDEFGNFLMAASVPASDGVNGGGLGLFL